MHINMNFVSRTSSGGVIIGNGAHYHPPPHTNLLCIYNTYSFILYLIYSHCLPFSYTSTRNEYCLFTSNSLPKLYHTIIMNNH